MVRRAQLIPLVLPKRSAGLTLMELLTVIAIMSLMLTLSAAAYVNASRAQKAKGAAADLDVILRQVKNSAVGANATACVDIDEKKHNFTPWVYRTVGFWHFEDRDSYGRSTGAYHEAVLRGAELFPEGKIGKCAKLNPRSCVDLGASPDYDFEEGGYLEAYIRGSHEFSAEQYIFFKEKAYFLKLGAGGFLAGNAGNHTLKSAYRVIPGRWTKVAFAWDKHSTRLLADDAIVAVGDGSKPALSDNSLLIGHSDAGSFDGLVDEVRVMAVSVGKVLQLPESCTIKHNTSPWSAVYFGGDGSLDMRYHAGPVKISLSQDGRVYSIGISMLGETTRAEVEKAEPKPEENDSPEPNTKKGKG